MKKMNNINIDNRIASCTKYV